jgi:hypothetical protein
MKYKEYEKAVFDWLNEKHEKDSKFNFSVRQKGSKGAELDYFIGTAKSNYFGTTFWSIPVAYPGSSTDLINLIFSKSEGNLFYEFQFTQTRKPHNNQNRFALELITGLRPQIKEAFPNFNANKPEQKQEYFRFKSPQAYYTSLEEMFADLDKDIEKLLPIVDAELAAKQKAAPSFIGSRISQADFDDMITRMHLRFAKYSYKDSNAEAESITTIDVSDDIPLNKILYGPPGTGKTYKTIEKAIEIIDPSYWAENWDNRTALKKRFRELLIKDWNSSQGRVVFCTFHQSYAYEDFVEGIKPKFSDKESGDVTYHIEDGVFKRICQLAKNEQKKVEIREERIVNMNESEYKTALFYKLSLGDSTMSDDQMIYDYCIKNNVIAIGFADEIDFTDASESEVNEFCKDASHTTYEAQVINYFKNYLKVGNYVVISKGNKYVRALGRVMGEYEYKPDSEIRYPHFRSVEWIFKDEEIPAEEIYNTGLTQRSIYKMDESGIKKDFFVNQSATLSKTENNTAPDNFVLIIDEINRGNVSSILGELITLIEKDKRKGGAEELETTLPYSKAPFSVPNNLYIIGTMNTADRSVEALDSALRRRFEFEEIAPNALLPLLDYEVYGLNVRDMLSTINYRIEMLLDKDHTIGHSYFILPTSNSKTDEDSDDTDSSVNAEAFVQNAFYSNIIPLLQEYFFGDVAKIGLILGKGFVQEVTSDSEKKGFAEFEYPGIDDFDEIKRYKIIDYRDKEELEGVVSGFAQALSTMMGK